MVISFSSTPPSKVGLVRSSTSSMYSPRTALSSRAVFSSPGETAPVSVTRSSVSSVYFFSLMRRSIFSATSERFPAPETSTVSHI